MFLRARGRASRCLVGVAVAGLAALVLVRCLWRAKFLYEWDAAQYALGVLRFDVAEHRPHPPGYPLWVLLLKAVHVFVADLNAAQIVLAWVVTGVAVWAFHRLARRVVGPAAALLATAFLVFCPTVILYSTVASIYPADLLTSIGIAALALGLWQGEPRRAEATVVALALLAGVRESGAVLMSPLVLVALVRALRMDVRRWATCALAGGGALAVWYVPLVQRTGGLAAYRALNRDQILGSFRSSSVFFGASPAQHWTMLGLNALWAAAAIAVAVVTAGALQVVGRCLRVQPLAGASCRPVGAAFYATWMLPNLACVTLLHSFKPGYLLLDVPPAMLLLARAVAPALEKLGARTAGGAPAAAVLASLAPAIAGTALVQGHYGPELDRTTLASVRDSDADTAAIVDLAHSPPGDGATLVVVLSCGPFGPNVRTLSVHLPETRVAILAPDGVDGLLRVFLHDEFVQTDAEAKRLAPEVKRILWLSVQRGATLRAVRDAFPGTHVVHYGKTVRVFQSELPEGPIDAHLTLDRTYHLVRAASDP